MGRARRRRAIGLYGLAGLLHDAAKTRPPVWAAWVVGCLVVHDAVIAPAVHLAGWWLRRRVAGAWRWPLQLGLVTSGVLVLASIPVLVGVGRATQPGNASVLPGDYPRALLVVLVAVWACVAATGLVAARRRRPARASRRGAPGARSG